MTSEGGGGGGGGGGSGGNHHPVIDYRVTVSRLAPKKSLNSNERVMAAGLSKMLRRFSVGASEISTNKSENKSWIGVRNKHVWKPEHIKNPEIFRLKKNVIYKIWWNFFTVSQRFLLVTFDLRKIYFNIQAGEFYIGGQTMLLYVSSPPTVQIDH